MRRQTRQPTHLFNSKHQFDPNPPKNRLYEAIHILLSYQNGDGGWATYENNRGYGWYEWLNPSEVSCLVCLCCR